MNGVVHLSLPSGLLLFSEEFSPHFGLSSPRDPLQQASFLFALFSSASSLLSSSGCFSTKSGKEEDRDDKENECVESLQWFTQERVVWYFHKQKNALTAISVSNEVSYYTAQAIAKDLSHVLMHFDTTPSARDRKKRNKEFLKVSILASIGNSVAKSSLERLKSLSSVDIQEIFIRLEDETTAQWTNKALLEWKEKVTGINSQEGISASGATNDISPPEPTDCPQRSAVQSNSSRLLPPVAPPRQIITAIKSIFWRSQNSVCASVPSNTHDRCAVGNTDNGHFWYNSYSCNVSQISGNDIPENCNFDDPKIVKERFARRTASTTTRLLNRVNEAVCSCKDKTPVHFIVELCSNAESSKEFTLESVLKSSEDVTVRAVRNGGVTKLITSDVLIEPQIIVFKLHYATVLLTYFNVKPSNLSCDCIFNDGCEKEFRKVLREYVALCRLFFAKD